jgi:hydroxymethylpyrimidine/phosphomethylpyrimidine kinase
LLRVYDTGVMNSSQMRNAAPTPVVVTIGGMDPGAGAGLGRDLLTATARGAAVRMVGTAWTEQSPDGVFSIEPRDPAALEDAVRRALRAPTPAAVKVGMLPGPIQADAILRGLVGFAGPLVVDPVLYASHGGALWGGAPEQLMPLLRRASLVTPNVIEAAALTGHAIARLGDASAAARMLRAAGVSAVLVKGGHLPDEGGDQVIDLLATAAGERRYARRRILGQVPGQPDPGQPANPRGTGCALATAIAIDLGTGYALEDAIERAATWLAGRIAASAEIDGERRLG